MAEREGVNMDNMIIFGFIKAILKTKGYGFLTMQHGIDIFFHKSACLTPFDELKEGQDVSFHIVTESNGREQAAQIKAE